MIASPIPDEAAATAAIVGVADTDYRRLQGGESQSAASLARDVVQAALSDAGLKPQDVDAVGIASYPFGHLDQEDLAALVGCRPRSRLPEGSVTAAVGAIACGEAETVVLVYATSQRSLGVQYGGARGTRFYRSYYYYHPWGFSSQGAHWALAFQRHQLTYGSTEEQLGAVAVELSKHASLNPRAVRQTALTLPDYLSSRYICRPLRRPDYCMVNDGAVALVLRRLDRSADLPHIPVVVQAHAATQLSAGVAELRPLVMDAQYEAIQAVTQFGLRQAGGLLTRDFGHFQVYDAFSVNLPFALEGAGFCPRGEGFAYIQDGRIGLDGEIPSNTSGGMLFESYMQGWNHSVEAVRQLRHEAGDRQVKDVHRSMYLTFTSGSAGCTILARADA
jgi:acetyl-CoA acetyltransferase